MSQKLGLDVVVSVRVDWDDGAQHDHPEKEAYVLERTRCSPLRAIQEQDG